MIFAPKISALKLKVITKTLQKTPKMHSKEDLRRFTFDLGKTPKPAEVRPKHTT